MKYLKPSLLIALLFSWSVHAAENTKKIDESLLVTGTWICLLEIEENGVKISITTEDNYVRNGRSNSFGTLMVKFSLDMPEMEYFIAGSAIWKIDGKYLITELTDIKIKNLSHPDFDKKFNLESMFPKNISESSEIIELSNSKLSLKSEADGTVYSCIKKKQ